MSTAIKETIQEVGALISSHSELKVNAGQLTVSKRDLQVAPEKYRAFLKPSALTSDNYEQHSISDLAKMDLKEPFVALDYENAVYLYLPA